MMKTYDDNNLTLCLVYLLIISTLLIETVDGVAAFLYPHRHFQEMVRLRSLINHVSLTSRYHSLSRSIQLHESNYSSHHKNNQHNKHSHNDDDDDNIPRSLPPPPMLRRHTDIKLSPTERFVSWKHFLTSRKSTSGRNLSSIPHFVQFCIQHQNLARQWILTKSHNKKMNTNNNIITTTLINEKDDEDYHVPNLLQGGSAAGPIAKTRYGQRVRALGAYPNLLAKPFHSTSLRDIYNNSTTTYKHDDLSSWVSELMQHLVVFQDELTLALPNIPPSLWTSLRTKKGQQWSDGTGWSHLAIVDNFRLCNDVMACFPKTWQIVCDIVGTERRLGPRLVAIARQKAKSGIPNHFDYMNWMLTLQLPLILGEAGETFSRKTLEGNNATVAVAAAVAATATNSNQYGIIVNGKRGEWKIGKPIIIDTTYEHSTYNDSEDDIYILLIDIWHPDLSKDEIDALRCFLEMNSGV